MAIGQTKINTTVHLTLSEVEAQVVVAVLSRVSGDHTTSYMREVVAVEDALTGSGVHLNRQLDETFTGMLLTERRPFEVS